MNCVLSDLSFGEKFWWFQFGRSWDEAFFVEFMVGFMSLEEVRVSSIVIWVTSLTLENTKWR